MSSNEKRNVQQQQKKQNAADDDIENVRNQNDIEAMAAARTGVHKDTVKTVFNAVWDAICEELENGNEVKLHGKGSFYLSKRSSRVGRNPLTGEEYDVPEREAMAFRTSPAYARRLRERRKELAKKNNQ
ncbi:MAG TPA: HU family DNA-binding protein [Bacillales bacterium]|nr:HU family DNA-binding protein [Bacillales bacterium]